MTGKLSTGRVMIIYTGGTIGSMPKDPNDPESPQVVVPWKKFMELTPQLSEKRLGFKVDAYSTEPLDSCNIGPKEWKEMAEVIRREYDKYNGFVILHGTDTMVYTASALSLMLNNLTKPVVITGSQLAFLFNERNDAYQNMITALYIANPSFSKIPVIPEVMICFGGKLLRGNRARKLNASGFNAYETPNYSPLAVIGESIDVDIRQILKIPGERMFNTQTRMETNVVALHFFPGIQDGKIIENVLRDKNVKGVVLMAYGAGNIPTKKEVLDLIREATDRGVVVVDVTQCGGGRVELGMYETSALLLDVGVVSGVDITPEAALTKLMFLLGDEDMTSHEVALKMQQSIVGEQSISISVTEFESKIPGVADGKKNRFRIPAAKIESKWDSPSRIDKIMLRFRNSLIKNSATNAKKEPEPIILKIYANLGSEDPLDENSPNYLGTFKKIPNDYPSIIFFDITGRGSKIISNRASFTVSLETKTGSFTWESVELAIFLKERV